MHSGYWVFYVHRVYNLPIRTLLLRSAVVDRVFLYQTTEKALWACQIFQGNFILFKEENKGLNLVIPHSSNENSLVYNGRSLFLLLVVSSN